MKKMKPSSYEGRQGHIPALRTPAIEAWEFQYPDTDTEIRIEIPEFTCICPKTGLPDFATLTITYVPKSLCLELKSLKEYICFYRDVGIFHEHVVNKVLRDCVRAVKPAGMEVKGVFNPRGGITTTARAIYGQPSDGCGCGGDCACAGKHGGAADGRSA